MSIGALLQLLYFAVLLSCCGYALWQGGAPERWGAAINITATVASLLLVSPWVHRWEGVEIGLFAVDCGVMLSFFVLAVRSPRYWPIWAFGFAMASVFSHVARLLRPGPLLFAYGNIAEIWAYLAILLLLVGTRSARRERALHARSPMR